MLKLDITFDQRKKCMVTPDTDMVARVDLGAALAHDNAARRNVLPIIAFHAEHFGVAIPTVAGTAYSFFMCHNLFLRTTLAILILDPCSAAATRSLLLWLFLGCCCFVLSFSRSFGFSSDFGGYQLIL